MFIFKRSTFAVLIALAVASAPVVLRF